MQAYQIYKIYNFPWMLATYFIHSHPLLRTVKQLITPSFSSSGVENNAHPAKSSHNLRKPSIEEFYTLKPRVL